MKASKASILRRAAAVLFTVLVLSALIAAGCNIWVVGSTVSRVFRDSGTLPANDVGLVLGSSKRTRFGGDNPYFYNRMEAAAGLYHAGKVRHLLLSGDNSEKYYNEPIDMKKALMALDVPDSAITLDYAGFRTLDAIVRCKKIFGQSRITIISQEFHNYRAVFISRFYDVDAVAFCAAGTDEKETGIAMREFLARVKAVIDLYIFETEPKFLGERLPIDVG